VRGRERRSWPEQCGRGGAVIAGGEEHAGTIGTEATSHGSMNREHREREGEQANTSGPIRRLEDAADKVADMAGGKELPGACDKAIQTTKREIN